MNIMYICVCTYIQLHLGFSLLSFSLFLINKHFQVCKFASSQKQFTYAITMAARYNPFPFLISVNKT